MNKDMRMAGDELTMPQLKAIYREVSLTIHHFSARQKSSLADEVCIRSWANQ